jgi:hypothetical protein
MLKQEIMSKESEITQLKAALQEIRWLNISLNHCMNVVYWRMFSIFHRLILVDLLFLLREQIHKIETHVTNDNTDLFCGVFRQRTKRIVLYNVPYIAPLIFHVVTLINIINITIITQKILRFIKSKLM